MTEIPAKYRNSWLCVRMWMVAVKALRKAFADN
jgi:hypothetical protein